MVPASTWSEPLGTTSELNHPACCFPPMYTFVPTMAFHLHPVISGHCGCWHLSTAWTTPFQSILQGDSHQKAGEACRAMACRGNTFMGASNNASCQSLKFQTEIKPCVCLFSSFREKHLNSLFSAIADKPHKNGNSLLICKSFVLQERKEKM